MANLLVVAVDTGNKNIKTPHTEPFNSGLSATATSRPPSRRIPSAMRATTIH